MVTPVEVGAGKKALDWIRGGATYLWKLGKRIATLEERVTALEQELKRAPAEACQYCGARELRLVHQDDTVKGDHPKRWTEEEWCCGECGQDYTKRKPI